MKKSVQRLIAGSCAAMVIASMAGCASGDTAATTAATTAAGGAETTTAAAAEETTAASEEVVQLSWYMAEGTNAHTDIVTEELNNITRDAIGVEVDYNFIDWGDWDQRTNTMMSAAQPFDIMFCNGNYLNVVKQGSAAVITEQLKASEMYEVIPETVWKAATYKGDIYGVPTYKDNAYLFGMVYNETLAQEIGLEMPEVYNNADPVAFDALIRDAHAKINETFGEGSSGSTYYVTAASVPSSVLTDQVQGEYAVTNISDLPGIEGVAEGQVVNPWEYPEMLEMATIMHNLVQDGIIPLDKANFDADQILRKGGNLLFNIDQGYVSVPENHWADEFVTKFAPAEYYWLTTVGALGGANVVGVNTTNLDKSVEFLNLVNTNRQYATTLRFGVEGEYWTKTDDDRASFEGTLNSNPAERAHYKWYGFQYGNIFQTYLPVEQADDLFTGLQAANEAAIGSDLLGFAFDNSAVVNEVTACDAVYKEYRDNLLNGMTNDPAESIAEMNEALYAAGLQKILDEAQAQVNQFRTDSGLPVYEG